MDVCVGDWSAVVNLYKICVHIIAYLPSLRILLNGFIHIGTPRQMYGGLEKKLFVLGSFQ